MTDQLGTPRMVIDQTGSLASVKRHNYLPFGEELFAATGGGTAVQGYSASDGVRQQFTSKERDNETGLDYFGARYYSSIQGRFAGVDPITITEHRLVDPQTLSLYAYCRNDPIIYTDPTGADIEYDAKGTSTGTAMADAQKQAIERALLTLRAQSKIADSQFGLFDKNKGS